MEIVVSGVAVKGSTHVCKDLKETNNNLSSLLSNLHLIDLDFKGWIDFVTEMSFIKSVFTQGEQTNW